MNHKPGTASPRHRHLLVQRLQNPAQFTEGETLPECPNMCGRGLWELVQKQE